jgi:Na+-driven multidrug efflux pump
MTTDVGTPRFDPRTRVLLEGPILSTLVRLAAPNVLVMLIQAGVGLIETYFVGKLGTDALAGVTLVFPVLMLIQMMSAGAMGGGISSAVARALGAGRRGDADALAFHALVIGLVFGLGFTLAVLGSGPWLYAAMGGRDASLTAALTYSNVIFSAAVLVWLFNSLANVIRGTGNMLVPAMLVRPSVDRQSLARLPRPERRADGVRTDQRSGGGGRSVVRPDPLACSASHVRARPRLNSRRSHGGST